MRCADAVEKVSALGTFDIGESEQKVLGGDELVAQLARVCFRFIEDLIELPRERGLRARLLREAGHLPSDRLTKLGDADP